MIPDPLARELSDLQNEVTLYPFSDSANEKIQKTRLLKELKVLNMLLISGRPIHSVCSHHNVSPSFVHGALRKLRNGKLSAQIERGGSFSNPRNRQFPPWVSQFFEKRLRLVEGLATLQELQSAFKATYPDRKCPSISTIRLILKKNGITRKKVGYSPSERNTLIN